MTKVRLLKKYYKRYLYIRQKYRHRVFNTGECRFSRFGYSCDMCPHDRFLRTEQKKVDKLINRVIGHAEGYWYMDDIIYTIRKIELKRKGI